MIAERQLELQDRLDLLRGLPTEDGMKKELIEHHRHLIAAYEALMDED